MKVFFLLFAMSCTFVCAQQSDFNHVDFSTADSLAMYHKGESLHNLPVLTHKLTATLNTDVEKFRAIYTWICTNIENDYSAYQKTKNKRRKLANDREALLEWNNNFTPKVFQKLREERKTACTGYAYLTRELATLAGLKSEIVDGHGRTATVILNEDSLPNHSWNAVQLNGKWYLCDPTWSAGRVLLDDGAPRFENDYHKGYFLADPKLFIKNHFPLQTKWTLLENPPTYAEYTAGPLVYKESFKPVVIPISPKEMHLATLKNGTLNFSLEIPISEKQDKISLSIHNGIREVVLQPNIQRIDNYYNFHHTFERIGKFDVHIQVNNNIIATYVVQVKRKKLKAHSGPK